MTDRPIIFSGPMVRALIDGRKTQTRRVLADKHGAVRVMEWDGLPSFVGQRYLAAVMNDGATPILRYAPGDRLWVREALRMGFDAGTPICQATYAADGSPIDLTPKGALQWAETRTRNAIPSIHMPRWASRLTLTVTDVRVQRLQEISGYDAEAEGACEFAVQPPFPEDLQEARDHFRTLWNSIHGPDAWYANPWVAATSFTVERRNIDQ